MTSRNDERVKRRDWVAVSNGHRERVLGYQVTVGQLAEHATFLSDGVGLVIIGSIVYAGIQYSSARGDPQASARAINRVQSTLIALLIFIFGYAMLNYLIPAGLLR